MNKKANKVCNFFDFVFDTLLGRKTLYGDISSYHPENAPEIKLGEIIGANPNSYETKLYWKIYESQQVLEKKKHGYELDSMASHTV